MTGLSFGVSAAGLSQGDDVGSTTGEEGSSVVWGEYGAEVGVMSRRCAGGSGEAAGVGSWACLSFSRRALKSRCSVGRTRPLRSSSSLSRVMQLPRLGLMADMAETEELRAPRASRRVPANRMPKLPSPQSSKSSSSSAGVCGAGALSFNVGCALSKLKSSSYSASILRVDFFFPSFFIVPPSSAEDGTLVGIGMPACFAEWMARFVDRSSLGVSSTCQSSSPVLDSERTDMREDSDCMAEFLNSRPLPSFCSKSPSSQLSNLDELDALEAIEAMRWAKLRWGAAMLTRASLWWCVDESKIRVSFARWLEARKVTGGGEMRKEQLVVRAKRVYPAFACNSRTCLLAAGRLCTFQLPDYLPLLTKQATCIPFRFMTCLALDLDSRPVALRCLLPGGVAVACCSRVVVTL